MSKQTEYIDYIAPYIIAAVKKNGKGFPSAIIAHSITESGWGQSDLAWKYFNYFGMKCGGAWKGKSVNMATKEEYSPGVLTSIRDNFRAYDSLEEGIQGYFDFLAWSHYNKVWTAKTPEDFLQYLKDCGYCTSTTWVNTVHTLIRQYDLKRFDDPNFVPVQTQPNISPVQNSEPAIIEQTIKQHASEVWAGKWGVGEDRKKWMEKAGLNYSVIQAAVNKGVGK